MGWNGHYLIGYFTAITITALITVTVITLHDPAPTPSHSATSSCDVAREAFQTGSEAEIIDSLNALVADKTVNATARKNARYYIDSDKASKPVQERIQFFCNF